MDQYYETLGLQPGASQAEVKQAYRNLAKIWHPDRFADDPQQKRQAEEKIKQINVAYQQLKDYQPASTQSASTQAASAPPSTRRSHTHTGVSARPSGAEVLYNQGAENVKAGKYKEALEDFSAAIRLNPNYAEAYRFRGFVHSLLGFELGAESDLKKAAELGLRQKVSFNSEPPPSRSTASNPFRPPSTARATASRQPVSPPPSSSGWKCIQTLNGHTGGITAIALSRDGKTLASASQDATIQLWNLRTGRPFCTLTGHLGAVGSLAISGDGQLLVSGSEDQTVKFWHLRTGSLVRTLTGHRGAVHAVAISPNRTILASGSQDSTVRLWNLVSGELQQVLDDHSAPVRTVALSLDGRMLFSGSDDQTFKLYHPRSGELLRSLVGHRAKILALAISSDNHFATAGSDGQIKLWNERSLVTGSPVGAFAGHQGNVRAIAFSPDGLILASGSDDHTVRLWHPLQGETDRLIGHSSAITSAVYSADGKMILSSSLDKTIKLWRCDYGKAF